MKNKLLLTSCLLFSITGNAQIKPSKSIEKTSVSAKQNSEGELIIQLKNELKVPYKQSQSFEDFLVKVAAFKKLPSKQQINKESKEILHLVYNYLKKNTTDAEILRTYKGDEVQNLSKKTANSSKKVNADYFWESLFGEAKNDSNKSGRIDKNYRKQRSQLSRK